MHHRYEIKYGDSASTYKTLTTSHTVALVLFAIFTPLAGIGYFVIFLMMQKEAQEIFKGIMRRSCCAGCFRWCTGDTGDAVGTPGRRSAKSLGADGRESGPSIRGSMDSVSSEIGEKIAAAAKAHPGLPRVHEDSDSRLSAYHARPTARDSHPESEGGKGKLQREKSQYSSRTLSVMATEDGAQLVEKLVDRNGSAAGHGSSNGTYGHSSNSSSTVYTHDTAATASTAFTTHSANTAGSAGDALRASYTGTDPSHLTSGSHNSALFALSQSTVDTVHSPLGGQGAGAALRMSDGSQSAGAAASPAAEDPCYSDWLMMSDEQLMAAIDASAGEGLDYEYHDAVGNF